MNYSSPAGKKKITNDIIDQLNSYVEDARRPTEFARRKIEHEIRKLKTVDPPDYYDLLGMLAAVSGDVDETKRCHEAAINASGRNPYYRHHFAVSLDQFYLFGESLPILREIIDSDRSDRSAIDSYISALFNSGRFQEAEGWIDDWNESFPKDQRAETENVKGKMVPYMKSTGLSDSDVSMVFDRAFRVIRDSGAIVCDVTVRWPREDEDFWPAMIFRVSEPVERVADLVEKYCELEALDGDTSVATKVMASFDTIAA